MLTGKVWGTTEVMLSTPLIEVHKIIIKPNSECSMHLHRRKHNLFYVLKGILYIDVEKASYNLTDTTKLTAHLSTTVPPGEYHRFRTKSRECEALEIYYLEPLAVDIERRDVGKSRGNR